MKDFLVKVLGISMLLSIMHIAYLGIAAACIVAIVLNNYLDTKVNTFMQQKKELDALKEELHSTIRSLESEQGVLKLKVQNLANPGRKL